MLVADDVDARDVCIHAPRRIDADHLAAKVPGAEDELGRNDAVAQDALAVVDVLEEEVERPHALDHAALEHVPLGAGDDPGNEVEREDPLDRVLVPVHGEADALVEERLAHLLPAFLELLRG